MNEYNVSEQGRCFLSLCGAILFDYEAVANTIRSGSLTPLASQLLANMLVGKGPDGLTLKLTGQGRNWKPVSERVAEFERAKDVTKMLDRLIEAGATWEEATSDIAEQLSISESTVSRRVVMGRALQDIEK
jgi:hypothetical protein